MSNSNTQPGRQSQEAETAQFVSQSPPDPSMEREYEFFVTTEEPHQPEGPERGLIRRLVMRNYFETKSSSPTLNASEVNSASTVQSKQKLKSRFRLPKPGQEGDGKAKQKSKKDVKDDERRDKDRERRPRTRRVISTGSDESDASGVLDYTKSGTRSPEEESTNPAGKGRGKQLVLKINPNAHRFDPFDVLPVPGTPKLDILVKLYKCGSRTNAIAINACNTWWSFISNDAGLLHATLATWALYGILVREMDCLRVEMLRHKNESIKEINTKIGKPGRKITDELVGTVLTLASFETLLGAYDAAQLHIAALKRMVTARGGLYAFGHNDGLIKGITWVDFHTAVAFHTPPSFPQISIDANTSALPEALLEEAAYTSPTSLLQFSLAAVDCFNIFYRLHRLGLAVSSQWIRKVNRLTVSNLLYETEYIILSVPDYSRDFLDFDLETRDDIDEDHAERASIADAAGVLEGLLAGAQMFIYAALREIPPQTKIFSILLDRLRVAIDRPDVTVIDVWKREKNLNMLLWVLVMAASLASAWGERTWWISKLADVTKELNILSQIELAKALQGVAWTDVYFNGALDGIWEDVANYKIQMARSQIFTIRDNGIEPERGFNEAIDPRLLEREEAQVDMFVGWESGFGEKRFNAPMEFDGGRWKVNGWYI